MTLSQSIDRYKWQLLATVGLISGVYAAVIPRMVVQWYRDENYSHGFIVPLIAAYFLYERREQILNAPVLPWNPGLAVILLGLCQLSLGYLATEYFTMRSSLIVLLAGVVLFFFGREVFRRLQLPLSYLLLMVPLPYIIYNALAFPLKLFVTGISVAFLKLIGIAVLREGNIIIFPEITLEVADACSGMRSLMSMIALAVAYAFFIKTTTARKWIIVLSAIPIAIFTNAVRVIVTGILAQHWGARTAEGFFHEFAGVTVFVIAVVMLAGLGQLVGRGGGE